MLTLISVILNYTAPFFLKYVVSFYAIFVDVYSQIRRRILSEIEREGSTKESRVNAYIYAILALMCSLLKVRTVNSLAQRVSRSRVMFITYIRHKPTHSICGSAAEHPSECGEN